LEKDGDLGTVETTLAFCSGYRTGC
jgi:hypothetical protein